MADANRYDTRILSIFSRALLIPVTPAFDGICFSSLRNLFFNLTELSFVIKVPSPLHQSGQSRTSRHVTQGLEDGLRRL